MIYGTPVGGGTALQMYCIDIRTDTYIGNGYVLGTWSDANVPVSAMWPESSTSTTRTRPNLLRNRTVPT